MNSRLYVTSPAMNRTMLLSLLLFYYSVAAAQADHPEDSATIQVTVTDMKGKPTRGEQILFKAGTNGKFFSGHSGPNGKFSLRLPAGDKYLISVKSLMDSARYGSIDIPSLEPGQFFTGPFKVDVKFEPARSFTLRDVYFDVGKASLRPGSFAALGELLEYLQYKDDIKIEIAGHTDNIGKDDDNLELSRQRAETIRNYLIKKGIYPGRLVAKGYGASVPVADNDTEEGRQLNRRTEIRIL
jgi:OmpA-OmpF porin, OOP family